MCRLCVSLLGCDGLAAPPPTYLATGTSRNNRDRSDSQSSRNGESSMKLSGQSRKDPRKQMGMKRSPYSNSVICSQHITNVNSDIGKSSPSNFIKHRLNLATWNVLSLESSTSKLYELSENVSKYLNTTWMFWVSRKHTGQVRVRKCWRMGHFLLTLVDQMGIGGKVWDWCYQKLLRIH